MGETELILKKFITEFGNYKTEKLVIYGIGIMTKAILQEFPDFNIVGLMDETRAGESIYGKPILSEAEVCALGVKKIIIIATANNTNIIFRRITRFCKENEIDVYGLDGRHLSSDFTSKKSFEKYIDISYKNLQKAIESSDIISFDVFDTLIMRKTLYPRDVFHITAKRAGISKFASARIKAETELYSGQDIHKIYCGVAEILGLNENERDELMDLELAVEKEVIVPRKRMVAALKYARSLGKTIYLVSDMYLPNDIMYEILLLNGIQVDKSQILVSCDYNVSKYNGLFSVLREKAGNGRILHIGDNYEVDIASAKKYMIEQTFHIQSAYDMLADSDCEEMLTYVSNLSDRLVIGRFIASQLNDPFLFSETNGKFNISDNNELGQSFFAPMILNYIVWLSKKVKEYDIDYILCSARDGWFIKKLIESNPDLQASFPPLIYYLTSRMTAFRDILCDDYGILEVLKIKHIGSPPEMIKHLFHLSDEDMLPYQGEETEAYVLKHKDVILASAERMRKNNRKYIESLNLPQDAKYGYIDFTSSGTTQLGLTKISDIEVIGLYFLKVDGREFLEYKNNLKIDSLFVRQNLYLTESLLLNYYIEFENILTSYDPTIVDFDESGNPVFAKEKRKPEFLKIVLNIHEAIEDYCKEFELGLFAEMTNEVSELIFSYLNENYSEQCADYFKHNTVYDELPERSWRIFGTLS